MSRRTRRLLGVLAAVVLLVAVGPLVVPIPPLGNTVPPQALADADSRFVEVNGLTVHYKQAGAGQPNLILLHGFAASVFTWRAALEPLGAVVTVVAFDRPAFGLTERPLPAEWQGGPNPYSPEAQADLTVGLMDALGMERAVLVGNSAGGAVAMLTALRYPERVQALVLVDAAIYTGGGTPAVVRPLLSLPQVRRLGPLLMRALVPRLESALGTVAWHDPSRLTPEVLAGYRRPLQAQNWDVALWELTRASRPLGLAARLSEVVLPALVITGDDDRVVPTAESVQLAGELPNAELVVIPACGHVPQEECPDAFLAAVLDFVARRLH